MRILNEPLRLSRVWKTKAFVKELANSKRVREKKY